MDDQDNGSNNKPTKSYKKLYGKRPLWQWIALYVVLAVIVYGVIYLIFFNGNGSGTSPNAPLY